MKPQLKAQGCLHAGGSASRAEHLPLLGSRPSWYGACFRAHLQGCARCARGKAAVAVEDRSVRRILCNPALRPLLLILLGTALITITVLWSPATGWKAGSTSSTARAGTFGDLAAAAHPISGSDTDYDPLMRLIGDAHFVLLGEASHGTHEFYRERARITRRLIEEKGFNAVAIEGDWVDAERVDRFVRGRGADPTAEQALENFNRFPEWMWANTDIRDLAQWLRSYNAGLPHHRRRIGFYGLDFYDVSGSAEALMHYLKGVDPPAVGRARSRLRCFAGFEEDPLRYGRAAANDQIPSCATAVQEQFVELQQRSALPIQQLDATGRDELFAAVQHARVVRNAEEYYRTMFSWGPSRGNLRDQHMADTLDAIASHFAAPGRPGKVVVWAHNTHTGDARETELGESWEPNLGQLARQRHPGQAVLVGFTTHSGTVIAAPAWGEQGELKIVRPALAESYAGLFHASGLGNFLLLPAELAAADEVLDEPRLERAIGVVYLPQTERASHYFRAHLSRQFDAVIHLDVTQALEPLAR